MLAIDNKIYSMYNTQYRVYIKKGAYMTQLIVLGMLQMKPMSGYDIQVSLQELNAEMWSGVQVGSIYHALKKLEKDEYIKIDSISKTGFRQKATYRITKKGNTYLNKLIADELTKSSAKFPTGLYSAVTFIDNISKIEIQTALRKQLVELNGEFNKLNEGLNEKNKVFDCNLPLITEITFRNMFEIIQLQIKYVEELLSLIEKRDI